VVLLFTPTLRSGNPESQDLIAVGHQDYSPVVIEDLVGGPHTATLHFE
jgi:hypothetical protein